MEQRQDLPPGQRARQVMPRFGMTQFADRFPEHTNHISLTIGGDVDQPLNLSAELQGLPRVSQTSDFHCVTTWSVRGLSWSGYRFADVYRGLVLPLARPASGAEFALLRCQDGFRTSLPLEDLLAKDVLLADTLNGEPLSVAHGAPLRLVAPGHYGYKNAKHLAAIEFWRDEFHFRPWYLRWMMHQRGRVALEERARGVSGRLLRYVYRPFIDQTARLFARQLKRFEEDC
ncbi:MAG: molybdopterin-dependent oxidoreductase [Pseudomonadota bacterium]